MINKYGNRIIKGISRKGRADKSEIGTRLFKQVDI